MYSVIAISVLGTLFLIFLALNLSSGEKKIRYQIGSYYAPGDSGFERAMGNLLGPPIVGGNEIRSLINGKQIFPAMLDAIRSAKESITFETYIYWSGVIGKEFSEALADRARCGVRVHVLIDSFGSMHLDAASVKMMTEAGVQVERYHPVSWNTLFRLNQRTHRKLLIVDGKVGFIGGVGVADCWLGDADGPEHWRDSHFQVTGPAVNQLQSAFTDNWLKTRAEVLFDDKYFPHLEPRGESKAQVFRSSPREGSGSVRLMYLMSIAAARDRILLANAYFVPDSQAIEAFVAARQRGVQVEIIVPGPITDEHIVRKASRARWGKLLEAGVAIYEYQPTMYHCKVMVIDDCWVSVGSTNFDNRSFRLNDEANLNVIDREFAAEQAELFENDKRQARQITFDQWKHRPLREKAIEKLAELFRAQL